MVNTVRLTGGAKHHSKKKSKTLRRVSEKMSKKISKTKSRKMSKNLKGGKTKRRKSKRKSKKMLKGGAQCDSYTYSSHKDICAKLANAKIPLDIFRLLHNADIKNTIASTLPCNLTAAVKPCPEAIQIINRAQEIIERLDNELKNGSLNKAKFEDIKQLLGDKTNQKGNYYIPDGFDLRTHVIRTVSANLK